MFFSDALTPRLGTKGILEKLPIRENFYEARFMLNTYLQILDGYQLFNETMTELAIATILSAETDLANMVDRPVDIASVKGVMGSKLASDHLHEVAKIQWRVIPELAPYVRGDKFPRPSGQFLEEKRSTPYGEL